jgi:hypothetical protein
LLPTAKLLPIANIAEISGQVLCQCRQDAHTKQRRYHPLLSSIGVKWSRVFRVILRDRQGLPILTSAHPR